MLHLDRTAVGARPEHDTVKGLASGLVGGLVGSLAMAAFQGIYGRVSRLRVEPARVEVAGDALAGTEPSTHRAVQTVARVALGRSLRSGTKRLLGRAFHFAFGTGLGGAYGVLVEYVPPASLGSGIPFGAAQVLVADEMMVPALGLSEPPERAPAGALSYSLAAHMVYGFTTELVRRGVRARL